MVDDAGAERGPWRVLRSREVYRNPWIRVREDDVIRPAGTSGIYGVVECNLAVGVVALTDDLHVYLVGQYRYPTDSYSWEIVAGFADDDETPARAAARELAEEIGIVAAEWTDLGVTHLSNSVTDQVGHLYLARGLTVGAAQPDETEQLDVSLVPLPKALAMAQSSDIVQGFSLVGLYRAWHHLQGSGFE